MNFRQYLNFLDKKKQVKIIGEETDINLEMAALLIANQSTPLIFEVKKNSLLQVAGNIFNSRKELAFSLNLKESELIKNHLNALKNPLPYEAEEETAYLSKNFSEAENLDLLPIPRYFKSDGGSYITSGVVIARDPELGLNLSFHRLMKLDSRTFAIRIVERDLFKYLERAKRLEVIVVIGNSPSVLVAGATSVSPETDELCLANALSPLKILKDNKTGIAYPADSEIIFKGFIDLNNIHPEGPFIDITGTIDPVRLQPVLTVKKIFYRKNGYFHALLPSGKEHRLLMGFPKIAVIYSKVSEVADCLDVSLSEGGCGWLHGYVKIKKQCSADGPKVIEAAFSAHKSLKHVFVVDEDIDIYNPHEIEWAMATRFQGSKNLITRYEKGSSLDPSVDIKDNMTTKLGFDLTIPDLSSKEKFRKVC